MFTSPSIHISCEISYFSFRLKNLSGAPPIIYAYIYTNIIITCTEAPVISRISLIFEPPLPKQKGDSIEHQRTGLKIIK